MKVSFILHYGPTVAHKILINDQSQPSLRMIVAFVLTIIPELILNHSQKSMDVVSKIITMMTFF